MKKREWKEREQNRKKREKELNMLNEKKKALEEERKISESKEGGQGGPSGGTSSEKPADEYEYDSSDEEVAISLMDYFRQDCGILPVYLSFDTFLSTFFTTVLALSLQLVRLL